MAIDDVDFKALREEAQIKQAQEEMEEAGAVNLDEVDIGVIPVAFSEFIPDKKSGYRVETVHKEIQSRVPMWLLISMLANQKKVQKLRKKIATTVESVIVPETITQQEHDDILADLLAEDETVLDFASLTDKLFADVLKDTEPMLIWMAKEVLRVWKLTPGEHDMTLKRFLLGLDMTQVKGLFSLFFGASLLQKKSKARSVGNSISASSVAAGANQENLYRTRPLP